MKVLGYILQKEFLQIFRDRSILAMMFAMPTIQLIIIPLAMNFDVKNIDVVVVDNDHSSLSQKFISKIGASGYFRYVNAEPSYREALRYIENGSADLVMEIPAGLERNLVREGLQKVSLSVDGINGTKAALGAAYLNAVIADFNKSLPLNSTGGTAQKNVQPVIDITSSNWFNPLAEYKYYIVPGVLVLLLTLIGGFISALNIVKEKESGTIEQINVSPVKKWEFIVGKLVPFWVIAMIVFSIGLAVTRLVYGISPQGNIGVLYLFAAVYLIALLGFGLLISTYSNNQLQAMFIAYFFMMIFMLMSGLFTSVESMPAWAKMIANLTPITHFIKVVRMIVLKGSGFADIRLEFFYMILFAIALNGWAIWNYRKTS
ncbi:ABC transporter permease [Agriterribacter sp.]|uniref:ABC transporter permease n=1 Tax=Agriterribacter sp. TaxID=2821509 RepID=UPI002B5848A0|nr:ABC transporter permease [Agriterribacter sp.]HRO44249.1 ABC transporter permease [Agriterribacter sp.]HRQ19613.1 ABC transporter permease [Agriterribacter sp.]